MRADVNSLQPCASLGDLGLLLCSQSPWLHLEESPDTGSQGVMGQTHEGSPCTPPRLCLCAPCSTSSGGPARPHSVCLLSSAGSVWRHPLTLQPRDSPARGGTSHFFPFSEESQSSACGLNVVIGCSPLCFLAVSVGEQVLW